MDSFQQAMGNAHFCRGYFLFISFLEISDVASDCLWWWSVWSHDAFHHVAMNDDRPQCVKEYDDDGCTALYHNYFLIITYSTNVCFLLSLVLLVCKISTDLKDILGTGAANPEEKSFKRMEIFGISPFFLLSMPNQEVTRLYQQQKASREVTVCNIIDSIVGISNPDNYLDWNCPYIADILTPSLESEGDMPVKLWEVLCYPVTLTFSWKYFRSMPVVAFVYWPISCASLFFCMFSMFFVGVANLFSKSEHIYTIRLFEDIPQLIISIVFLTSPYGKDEVNLASVLTLALSTVMLSKFAIEVAYQALTTDHKCQLVSRNLQQPHSPTALHVIYVTCIAPCFGTVIAAVLMCYILVKEILEIPSATVTAVHKFFCRNSAAGLLQKV